MIFERAPPWPETPRNSPWLLMAELLRWRSCLILRTIQQCHHLGSLFLRRFGLANACALSRPRAVRNT